MELTLHELNCIRFYMGDEKIVNSGYFKGGPKAYNTINALLHDGIWDEVDKFKEGKVVEIYDVEHLKSYLDLIVNICVAMHKYSNLSSNHLVTYRVDRISAIEYIKSKMLLEGFYSTCKYTYLESYAKTKANVVLLEIVRNDKLPYLDFEAIFKNEYAKNEEAEILIPFNTKVDKLEEIALSYDEECKYIDMYGNKPKGKYRLTLGSIYYEDNNDVDYECLVEKANVQRVIECIDEIKAKLTLNECDLSFYLDFKDKLRKYILMKVEKEINVL